jgi:hypothetical protein
MQQHNGFWISGSAVTGPPYTDYWTPAGAVLFQRTNGSVVELVRFNLESFELEDQGVAALFGLELARLVVDTSYTELLAKQRDIVRRTNKPSNPR